MIFFKVAGPRDWSNVNVPFLYAARENAMFDMPTQPNAGEATPSGAPVPPLAAGSPCAACGLLPLCFPHGRGVPEPIGIRHQQVRKGDRLFSKGDPFLHVQAVRTGYFKTVIADRLGTEQVIGFHLPGDLLGLDGMLHGRHGCDAIALDDSEVCVASYFDAGEMCRQSLQVQEGFWRSFALVLTNHERRALLLGQGVQAQQRLAMFLEDWVRRLRAAGLPHEEIVLPMSRQEIGSLLGLALETVSRCFARLESRGAIDVRQRSIRIVDAKGLASAGLWPGED